jgi:hypothetical protein
MMEEFNTIATDEDDSSYLPSKSLSSGSDSDTEESDISQLETPTEYLFNLPTFNMFNTLSIATVESDSDIDCVDGDSDIVSDENGSDYDSVSDNSDISDKSDISDIAQLETHTDDLSYLVKSTSALTNLIAKMNSKLAEIKDDQHVSEKVLDLILGKLKSSSDNGAVLLTMVSPY